MLPDIAPPETSPDAWPYDRRLIDHNNRCHRPSRRSRTLSHQYDDRDNDSMTSTAHDRFAAVAPNSPATMPLSRTSIMHADDRNPETSSIASSGGFAVPPQPPVATESRAPADQDDKIAASQQYSHLLSTDERFSQSDPPSVDGSQISNATSASDRVFTPTPSDDGTVSNHHTGPSQDSQLMQLSAIAAAQDRMVTDVDDIGPSSRKRMADGEVKSPTKSHSRNPSAISMASTTSTIGDVS